MSPTEMILTLTTILVLSLTAKAQTPSCAEKLTSCAVYLNSTKPPSSCCLPLKEAVEKELTCLCNLYNTPGLLSSFGINITEALLLPARCKLSGDLSSCVKASSPTASASAPTSPASTDKDKNGVSRIAGAGLLSIPSFLLYVMIF